MELKETTKVVVPTNFREDDGSSLGAEFWDRESFDNLSGPIKQESYRLIVYII